MRETLTAMPVKNLTYYFPWESETGLNVLLVNSGHGVETHEAEYHWDGMRRGSAEMFIWQYTLSGRGCLDYEDTHYDILPGDAMLLKVPERHCYWLPRDSERWEFLYVSLAGSEIMRLGLEARSRLGVVAKFPLHSPVVRSAESIMHAGMAQRIKTRFEISRRAYSFMMDLLAEASENTQSRNEFPLEAAREYCVANISKPLTVDDLAAAAKLSRWHFSRRFQKTTGVAPHRYILETKMSFAAHLLLNSRLSVKEIASQCGYADTSYFCKSFKLVHGTSPGLFRAP